MADEKDNKPNPPVKVSFTKDKNSGLPVAEPEAEEKPDAGDYIPPDEAFKDTYRFKRDGQVYALAIVPEDVRGRTYHARNTLRQWSGTKEDFEAQFVKI